MNTRIKEKTIEEVFASGQLVIPTTHVVYPVGQYIYRARYHDSDRKPLTVGEIYYPPKEKAVLGRANHFEEQVFYGMLPTGDLHARLACYHEVMNRPEPIQTFTMSKWRIKKDLDKVLSLVMHLSQCAGHELAEKCYQHTREFLNELPEHIRPKAAETLDEIGMRFSREIHDCDYWWTAKLASHMFYQQDFNAIIFPSISYMHQAICIAMPGVIADEHIEPVSGSLFQLHMIDGRAKEFSYEEFDVEGDNLNWRNDAQYEAGRPEYALSTVPRDCSPCEKQRDLYFR